MNFRRFDRLSIKHKQVVMLMLTSFMALLLASAGFIVYEMLVFENDMRASLRNLAVDIGRDSFSAVLFNTPDSAHTSFQRFLINHPSVQAVSIYTTNGQEMFTKYPADFSPPPFPPSLRQEIGQNEKSSFHLLHNRVDLFERVASGSVAGGDMISIPIYVRSDLEPLYHRLGRYAAIVMAVFGISLVPVWLLSLRLQRLISEPILHLLQTARTFAETKNYSVRAEKKSHDEIGLLIDGFNAMLDQIQSRDAELHKGQAELEKKVEQRTAALRLEIAERLRVENALRNSEERFKLVVRATNDAVWDLNLVTNSLWWNEGFPSLFGYPSADAADTFQAWMALIHPDDADRVIAGKNKVIYSGENFWSDEYRFRRSDGSYAYIFDRGYVIRNPDKIPLRMVGAMADITERKRNEGALQQHLARISLLNQITHAIAERRDLASLNRIVLEQLERHLPVDCGAVLFYDAKTDTLSSAAVRVRSQFPDAEGRVFEQGGRFQPDALGLRECLKGRTLSSNHLDSALLAPLVAAGYHSRAATPLTEENNTIGVLVCARAEREFGPGECEFLRMLGEQVALAGHQANLYAQLQSAYDELRQTQQGVIEQERLRALGKMASGIAHDINNALSPVVVYSEVLLRDDHGLPPETTKNFLHSIKTAGEDIAHIVSRMREFYRRRENTDEVFACNLNDLVREVIDLTRPRWRDIPMEHGLVVEVRTDLLADLPEIAGNASELREAITNLVLNAVDAMPSGGEILLRTATYGWENHDHAAAPAHVMVEVRDSGMGMDTETRNRCLEPFFTTKGKRGTGLGLAMVYGIAERHDAKIEIESAPGKGAVVRLIFPISKSTPGKLDTNKIKKETKPLRVLCIDDEPLIRQMLKELLELDGHQVVIADGGEAGVEIFRAMHSSNPFDVVITDLGMPRLDGRQVASLLKKESPTIPVIMLTGWGNMMNADRDLPAQVDLVLSKPPRMKELREALFRLTHKSP